MARPAEAMTLRELIDLIESGAPDMVTLDVAILFAVQTPHGAGSDWKVDDVARWVTVPAQNPLGRTKLCDVPRYLTSLDDAMRLVPPDDRHGLGHRVLIERGPGSKTYWRATVRRHGEDELYEGGATGEQGAARALVLAALRARGRVRPTVPRPSYAERVEAELAKDRGEPTGYGHIVGWTDEQQVKRIGYVIGVSVDTLAVGTRDGTFQVPHAACTRIMPPKDWR